MSNEIILLSSNSRKEYIIDSLETIALPIGFVQHYRYRMEWVDPILSSKLGFENQKLTKEFRDSKMIICFLNQEISNDTKIWENIIPIREATLKFAYKTSNDKKGVVHFYFEVKNLIKPIKQFEEKIRNIFLKDYNKLYAKLTNAKLNELIVDKGNSNNFYELSEDIEKKGLKNETGKKYESPLFFNIQSIKKSKDRKLEPHYDILSKKSYFKLCEGKSYSLQYSSYANSKDTFEIKFKCDSKHFLTSEENNIKINAKYDQNSIRLMPNIMVKKVISLITIEVANLDKKENCLNFQLPIHVEIKVKKLVNFLELLSDFLFAMIAAILGLTKVYDKGWPYDIFYFSFEQLFFGVIAIWFSLKLFVKIWKMN